MYYVCTVTTVGPPVIYLCIALAHLAHAHLVYCVLHMQTGDRCVNEMCGMYNSSILFWHYELQWAGEPGFGPDYRRSSSPLHPDWPVDPSIILPSSYYRLCLNTYLNVVSSLRVCGIVPPLPLLVLIFQYSDTGATVNCVVFVHSWCGGSEHITAWIRHVV
jgi:hypothetical protein